MATFGNCVPDRYDKCPHCGTSWDGGNIKQALANMDINIFKHEQANKMADAFGYTDDNQKKFTNTIGIQIGEDHYFQCPSCRRIWDVVGDQYNSIKEIYENRGSAVV